MGGLVCLPDHLAWEAGQLPWAGAQVPSLTLDLRHLEGVLSLGLSFLICKVKEAAGQCPLRVLSAPKVKVWISWAQDVNRWL